MPRWPWQNIHIIYPSIKRSPLAICFNDFAGFFFVDHVTCRTSVPQYVFRCHKQLHDSRFHIFLGDCGKTRNKYTTAWKTLIGNIFYSLVLRTRGIKWFMKFAHVNDFEAVFTFGTNMGNFSCDNFFLTCSNVTVTKCLNKISIYLKAWEIPLGDMDSKFSFVFELEV